MANEQVGIFTVSASIIEFEYNFQIQGQGNFSGKGCITIGGSPSQEKVQEEVNRYIAKIISNHVNPENVGPDGSIQANINATVTSTKKLKTDFNISRR